MRGVARPDRQIDAAVDEELHRVVAVRQDHAWGWDLAPDGRIAVLTAVPVEGQQAPQPTPLEHTVMFLQNFFDELRRSVPVE
jgi:hypothetical protein